MVRELDYEICVMWMTNGRPHKVRMFVPAVQGDADWRLLMSYVLKVYTMAVDKGAGPKRMIWRVRRA